MTAADRARRAEEADRLCAEAYQAAGGPEHDVALVAVGGFGRAELAPYSDWDVVLVHADGLDLDGLAERVWYPLWDTGARLDHAVRSLGEMVSAADADLRVALGLLDVRHLAGDPSLSLQVRTRMLAHWRQQAPGRLPELHRMVTARHELVGELAHASVPDLKEAAGGLRDATTLKAVVATWLVDVPHVELERCRQALLDVRDLVHELAGRSSDRIAPELWDGLAERLDLADARAAQVHVRMLGRRITHLSRLTWRRVDDYLKRPEPGAPRRPHLTRVAPGVAVANGEVVLTTDARPGQDPVLLLRAAAEAAEHGIVLAPPTAARLARESAPLPTPWPAEARQQLVRLLSSGRGLLEVWETLEETGAIDHFLPEWERVRLLPHASEIHRFTVDRHSVEACIEASALIRGVSRPDVLVVTALLHDIGKGSLTEHSVAGEPIAREVATRMGFDAEAVELIATLVRWHLLLATTATTRDPDDPATAELVVTRIGDPEALDLLAALTEADARATSPKAWSAWRSRLIRTLAERARAAAGSDSSRPAGHPQIAIPAAARRRGLSLEVEPLPDGARITVIAADRVGLMADVAATLAFQRIGIRAARAWGQDRFAVSVWEVSDDHVDERVLRERFEAIADGRVDPMARLRPADPDLLSPSVAVRPEASSRSTVLEVRTADRPGVVFLVAHALAHLGIAIRSAHVDTLGPQAVDVFYLQEAAAGALADDRSAEAARAVRAALSGERP